MSSTSEQVERFDQASSVMEMTAAQIARKYNIEKLGSVLEISLCRIRLTSDESDCLGQGS
ncbi:MAG: hypothetical protein IPK13_17210 [Deltaproteobacteria bacterium]|nr:hypothetical protein [Deltaproteobacteria bacterium]